VSEYPPLPILGDRRGQKSQRLQVLTLTPFYPSEGDDAGGCFIAEPISALEKIGIKNTVYAVQPFYRKKVTPGGSPVRAKWLRYFALPSDVGLPSAGAFLFARIVARVRELKAQGKIDLIHAHAPLPCGHAAMLLSAELGLPFVVTVHGLDAFSTEQVKGKAGQWCRRISQRVFHAAKRVICISERVREQVLEGTGSRSKTSVVYNAVDSDLFAPASDSISHQSILSVGNLIPIKGHATLLRAFAAISADFPQLRLRIIGSGPELASLKRMTVELNIADRVQFLGRRSRRQVAGAMGECTVFALPSRYEGLGCVYLEAMSSGKPAIGCRGQGIAEVIQQGSNGYLVGPDNEKELALVLKMLVSDTGLQQRISIAARDTILDRFTLAQQAQRLARIYRECAA